MKITIRTVAVAVAVAVATLAPSTSWAADEVSAKAAATLGPTPFANNSYGPGAVGGQAELEEEDGRLTVRAEVEGLKPGTAHIGHIHFGDCTRLFPGEIILELKPVMIGGNGKGGSVTVIDDTTAASLAAVQDCRWWVAFHEGAADSSPQSPAVAIGPVLLNRS